MHEFSLAKEIISQVGRIIPVNDLPQIQTIKIHVGEFSNVMPDSLLFAFNSLIEGTILNNVRLELEIVALKVKCNICQQVHPIQTNSFVCPNCNSRELQLFSGSELFIESILMKDN
jgi:hydrogenase nickel incorporation protein HypA/HybF